MFKKRVTTSSSEGSAIRLADLSYNATGARVEVSSLGQPYAVGAGQSAEPSTNRAANARMAAARDPHSWTALHAVVGRRLDPHLEGNDLPAPSFLV